MKKLLVGLFGALGVTNAFANPACAVCTLAIGGTITLSQKLGLCQDAVAVWVGAFLVILGYWAIKWFDKKRWHFFGRDALLMLISFSMIAGLYIPIPIGHGEYIQYLQYDKCYWILDSFLFWAIVGGVVYVISQKLYEISKTHNNNHAHFPFEKVVMAIVMLTIVSILVSKFAL